MMAIHRSGNMGKEGEMRECLEYWLCVVGSCSYQHHSIVNVCMEKLCGLLENHEFKILIIC